MMIIPAADVVWEQLHERLTTMERGLADKDLQLADVRRERDEEHRRAEHEHQLAEALQVALANSVTIEQAVGIVAEKAGVGIEEAKARLKRRSRDTRQRIDALAARVVATREPVCSRPDPEVDRIIVAAVGRPDGVPIAFWDALTLNGEIFK